MIRVEAGERQDGQVGEKLAGTEGLSGPNLRVRKTKKACDDDDDDDVQ